MLLAESLSIELIASLIRSPISYKNDIELKNDQTLFLKNVLLTRELLPQQVHFKENGLHVPTFCITL